MVTFSCGVPIADATVVSAGLFPKIGLEFLEVELRSSSMLANFTLGMALPGAITVVEGWIATGGLLFKIVGTPGGRMMAEDAIAGIDFIGVDIIDGVKPAVDVVDVKVVNGLIVVGGIMIVGPGILVMGVLI